jgi:hypothetical protein
MALGLLGLAVTWGCGTEPTLPISVTVSPPAVSVVTGGSQDFSTTVTNDPAAQGVSWSITGCTGGAAACGTLTSVTNAAATYTAPAIVPLSTLGVTARSVADNSKSFTSVVTINPVPGQVASLTVSPESVKVVVGGTFGLSTQVEDQLGNTLLYQAIAWSSDNATVATVRVSYTRPPRCRRGCPLIPTGGAVVMGLTEGATRIIVSLQGRSDTSFITVVPDTIVPATLISGLEYPTGLWIKDGSVYLTETAGRNTTFGGKIDLLRYDVTTKQTQVLLNHPANSDAVVVTSDGRIYLTSYQVSLPGDTGDVSVARFDSAQQVWVETHLLSLAIASIDMFLDANGDIYVIGSSDARNAASLYRLPFPDYATAPSVVSRGLGRASSLTKIGSDIYYSKFGTNEVRRLTGGTDTSFVTGVTALSLTSDGTFLYMSEFLTGQIIRKNLSTGGIETIAVGLRNPSAVRYDPQSGNLYFLEGGTEGAQYKDGTLKVIVNLH